MDLGPIYHVYKIYEFYKNTEQIKLYIFQTRVFKFGGQLVVWMSRKRIKLQLNNFKIMPARLQNTGTQGVNTTIVLQFQSSIQRLSNHGSQ